jgi:hypothetical protein
MAKAMPMCVVLLQIILRTSQYVSKHTNVGGFLAIPEYNAQQLHSLGFVLRLQSSPSFRHTRACRPR